MYFVLLFGTPQSARETVVFDTPQSARETLPPNTVLREKKREKKPGRPKMTAGVSVHAVGWIKRIVGDMLKTTANTL